MKHTNIALFVPHIGCPNQCSFCNQHIISGSLSDLKKSDVENAVKTALSSGCTRDAQLAFFGGSFTAIDREYMLELLNAAKPFIDEGKISGIRISTRPDSIDEEILKLLKAYGVKAVELGAQSMDDRVLKLNRRGHTAKDVTDASKLIKENGFELGLQMMTGLYGDTDEGAVKTAKEIIDLKPDTVRIYPTVVLEGTSLAELYEQGIYNPQTLEDAVRLCAELLMLFYKANIPVIRLGLHSGGNVDEGYISGVYHPAFRELCEGEIYLKAVLDYINQHNLKTGSYIIYVNPKEISKMTGQKSGNLKILSDKGFDFKVLGDENLNKYDFNISQKAPSDEGGYIRRGDS